MKQYYHQVILGSLLLLTINTGRSFGADPIESLVQCVDSEATKEIFLKITAEEGFKKSGQNFFTPVSTIKAFGFSVAYVGTEGVDMVPGPNITLNGKYNEVEKAVKTITGLKFKCGPGGCDHQVDKDLHVMIYQHPTNSNLTIVQCGAVGP